MCTCTGNGLYTLVIFAHSGGETLFQQSISTMDTKVVDESSGYQSATQSDSSLERSSFVSDTPVVCACGKCQLYTLCTKGCLTPAVGGSASLPIWNGTENNCQASGWQFQYENKLTLETENISFAFASLVNHTLDSFTDKVSLNRIVLWLKQLKIYKPLINSLPLVSDRMGEVCKVENMQQLFNILSNYWSWYNYDLLENLIVEFGGPEDTKRLKEYHDKFTCFIMKRLPKSHDMFSLGTDCGKPHKQLIVKVDEKWETISLMQIREFHYKIAEILKVQPRELYLSSVKNGCICLNFFIQESTIKYALPLCVSQEEALLAAGVFRLECGEYVWQVSM